jgi:16S rRNA (cytidine1402-2'-O)-methyltransferase
LSGESVISTGVLYVIATPIGNLADVSDRMREVIAMVDCLYAEDTRHTGMLCQRLGLSPPLRALHDHNEGDRVAELLERLADGAHLGLVSDAGTPLISDPGYKVVSACHRQGIRVSPVPGPSSVIAALSVCGLPTDRFCFYGFLPAKSKARRDLLAEIAQQSSTSVLFESKHRIVKSLLDICELMGEQRPLCIARELTKTFETVMHGEAGELCRRIVASPESQKGEFVIIVRGLESGTAQIISSQTEALLVAVAAEVAPRKAAAIVADHVGVSKKVLYQWLVERDRST